MDYDFTAELYRKMKLEEAIEGDINRVAKQFPDIHKDVIKQYASEADPKQDKGSRYIDWLVKGHASGSHGLEDTTRLKSGLDNFEKHKSKLDKKDINQYKHISEIEDAVAPHVGTLSNTQKKDPNNFAENPDHREKVYDNGKGLQVFHTKTKEASQAIYGGGHQLGGTHTSWCTAARSEQNRFDHYSDGGKNPLYQIHTPDNKVYQDEFSGDFSGGLRNAADASVDREKLVKENPDLTKVPAFQGKDLSYSDAEHAPAALHAEIKKNSPDYDKIIAHPHLDATHISEIAGKIGGFNGPKPKQEEALTEHPAFNAEHLGKMVENSVIYNTEKTLKTLDHPKVDSSVLGKITSRQYVNSDIAKKVANHPALSESNINEILDTPGSTSLKTELFKSDKLTPEHINKSLTHPDYDTRFHAVGHPRTTDAQRESVISNDESDFVKNRAINTLKDPSLIEKHLDAKLSTNGDSERFSDAAASNPNANASTIRKAYPHMTEYNQREAVQHKNAPADIISEHLGTVKGTTKILALKAPNINSDHLKSAFEDKDHLVKQAVLRHSKVPHDLIDSNIDNVGMHGSISVSAGAKPEHLDKLSTSPYNFIRNNVAQNKNTSKETLTNLSNDTSEDVKASALKSLKKKK